MAKNYEETERQIKIAIEVLQRRGVTPNIAEAAREFNVPEQRLRARWKGKPSKLGRPASNKKLNEEQELALMQYIKQCDEIGASITPEIMLRAANSLLKMDYTDLNSFPPSASKRWTQRWFESHPVFQKKKQKIINIKCKNTHNPAKIAV